MDDSVKVKQFTLRIETPDGAMPPARIEVPDVPLCLVEIVSPLYELCDAGVSLAVRKAASGGAQISCQKGCGVCCCQLVPVSIPEALLIADQTLAANTERSRRFRRGFDAAQKTLSTAGLWDALQTIDAAEDQTPLARAYWELGIPCPFLENEACAIHAIRPCACREYNVKSDPVFCRNPFGEGPERIAIPRKTTTALANVAAQLLGEPPQLIPLIALPSWFEAHAEIATHTWGGIELFDLALQKALS